MSWVRLSEIVKGWVLVLVSGTALFGETVIDTDFDNKWNEFGHSWFYYDDKDRRDSSEIRRTTPSTPSKIQAPYVDDNIRKEFFQDKPEYQFLTANDSNNSYGTMPFTFGSFWKTSWGTVQPFVGIGTRLTKDGSCIDLNSTTVIKFKIRSHSGNITARFMVQTREIEEISSVKNSLLKGDEFGFYGADIFAGKKWSEFTINVKDLDLPGGVREIPFNIRSVTKLVWEVNRDRNPNTITDTLDIDDVRMESYVDPTFWYKTTDKTVPSSGEFATFDSYPYNKSALNTFWYAYNDSDITGNSYIFDVSVIPGKKHLELIFKDKTGSEDLGQGALLEYQLGAPVSQGSNLVQGFVGIGIDVYDSVKSEYWNAKSKSIKNIYFHYMTDGDANRITLEISDKNDVSDAQNPTRMDSRGSGVVYYRNLPQTNGKWRAVEIPLDSLIYHDDWPGSKYIALDLENLAKLQWKVQGKEDLNGKFAIDNIYFTTGSDAVIRPLRESYNSAFLVKYANGRVHVTANSNTYVANGKVSLCNVTGKQMMTNTIKDTNAFSINFSVDKFAPGLYILKLQGLDTSGKTINLQSPVNVVR